MRITVYGNGNVGGGLADLWERAGHQVTRLKRRGLVGGFVREGKSAIMLSTRDKEDNEHN
jgi:glycerol-3-phosphate dehydrogenase